ncbi:RagB/SusD family nutrient uptake outer membrane protein [Chitinophaga alhagiae]|uniref:RagB/SusD family nutrient uptake outer membrane protein n=1 Tax=Chitinophaga alhagiae TaxID=2203219 RepID=UPI000E5A7122|nr:RagB/SusD family nutrient uptake outer membrane protein [Chitinophaga alhagiae]
MRKQFFGIRVYSITVGLVLLVGIAGCSDFLSVPSPSTILIRSTVFENDQTAYAALSGVYSQMIEGPGASFASGGTSGMSLLAGLSAGELIPTSGTNASLLEFYTHGLSASSSGTSGIWQSAYKIIYQTNALLEGVSASDALSKQAEEQITAQAFFLRAFCYFYLVNLFGDVPLAVTTDYRKNALLPRAPKDEVYRFILKDLQAAYSVLPPDYLSYSGERSRPGKWAAALMLARVHLYLENWQPAVQYSEQVLGQFAIYRLAGRADSIFLKNSPEAIWQLAPVATTVNTWEGNVFINSGTGTVSQLDGRLVDELADIDQRKRYWIKSAQGQYYPSKYTIKTGGTPLIEYSMVIRLAEAYLICSEAKARLRQTHAALSDLNMIRLRAGLTPLASEDANQVLEWIAIERKAEFLAEWGHRWLDVKRTGEVLPKSPDRPAIKHLYPIPLNEMDKNPHLSQNEGY